MMFVIKTEDGYYYTRRKERNIKQSDIFSVPNIEGAHRFLNKPESIANWLREWGMKSVQIETVDEHLEDEMTIRLEVFEDENAAELKIRVPNGEFVIQIVYENGEVVLELESGEFRAQGLNMVTLDPGLKIGKS